MKNSEKADVFFKVATENLNLKYCEHNCAQTVIVADLNSGSSPYICDNIKLVLKTYEENDMLQAEMRSFGMPSDAFGVWRPIEEGRRQEARWFFLMLMVEFLDNE